MTAAKIIRLLTALTAALWLVNVAVRVWGYAHGEAIQSIDILIGSLLLLVIVLGFFNARRIGRQSGSAGR